MSDQKPGVESRPALPRRDAAFEAALRERVIAELAQVKGRVELAAETRDPAAAKEQLRVAHSAQRATRLADAAEWLLQRESGLLDHFANGTEINPAAIDPLVIPVRTPGDVDLFRYATLQWSVPVSSGYGRRNRFLVRDRQNGKLIGIFALGDPVIAQSARDSAIGWTKEDRNARLYNVYDAFVLGAVEPYRQLLAGKLAALLTISNEVRDFLRLKYLGTQTQISKVAKDATPVLITTSSALGRSSVYNRVTYNGSLMFHPVGFTKGFGHFQFSDDVFAELLDFVRTDILEDPKQKVGRSSYGSGPNWRFRVIRTALKALDIPESYLQHNVKREMFLAPTAIGWDEYLRGERTDYEPFDLPTEEIGRYYRERWAIGRAERMPGYQFWRREEARLAPQLDRATPNVSAHQRRATYGRVDMGAYSVAIGTGLQTVRGTTISGARDEGTAYLSRVEGPGLAVTAADITWSNGEREIRGWDRGSSNLEVEDVVGRLRIGITPSTRFRNMSMAEIRVTKANPNGKATAAKTSTAQLGLDLGFDVAAALDTLAEATVGTRETLMRDEGPRRGQLCALFPSESRVLPAVLWALTRPISLITSDDTAAKPTAPVERRKPPKPTQMTHENPLQA